MDFISPVPIQNTAEFSRASAGRYRDRNHVLQSAAADVARFDYDPASGACVLLVEAAATNGIRNNSATGAAAGSPGTLPNFWPAPVLPVGVSYAVAGIGTDSGVDYLDLRIYGTAASAGSVRVLMETAGQITTAAGQKWAVSAYLKKSAGNTAGLAPQIGIDERDSGNASLAIQQAPASVADAGVLTGARASGVFSIGALTASVIPFVGFALTAGQAVDVTLRVGLPQAEQNRVTSPIRTTAGAVTRAADIVPPGCKFVCNLPVTDYPAWDAGTVYTLGARVIDAGTLSIYESLRGAQATVTITIAGPAVVSWPGHGFAPNTRLRPSTTGALPTGITAGEDVYVSASNLYPDTFCISATPGGALIITSGSQSGTHTFTEVANLGANPAIAGNSVSGTEATPGPGVKWLIVGKVNKWRAFDSRTSDQMTAAGILEFAIFPGRAISAAGFSNMTARNLRVSFSTPAEGLLKSWTQGLQVRNRRNWWEYWTAPFLYKTEHTLTGIPGYINGFLTVSLDAAGSTAGLGELTAGLLTKTGISEWGAKPGFSDFSTRETDAWGNTELKPGPYIRRLSIRVFVPGKDPSEALRQIINLRGKPAYFVGHEAADCLQLLGYVEDVDFTVETLAGSRYSIDLIGL